MKNIYLWVVLILIPLGKLRAQDEAAADQEIRPEDVAGSSTTSVESVDPSGVTEEVIPATSDPKVIAQAVKPEQETNEIPKDETWDSYTPENAAKSIALDITNGVRVNDIVLPSSEYHFASFGRPDPFVPQMKINRSSRDYVKESRSGYDEVQITSVLQKFPLSDLVVVGIWSPQNRSRKALISCPTGQGVVVQIGDPMGIKAGKVISINNDYLMVREFEISYDGTRQFEDKKVWLKGRQPESLGLLNLSSEGANSTSTNKVSGQNGYPSVPNSPQIPRLNTYSGSNGSFDDQGEPSNGERKSEYRPMLLSDPSLTAPPKYPTPPPPPPPASPPPINGVNSR
jgi:Tfp pilus assembly protein PilP